MCVGRYAEMMELSEAKRNHFEMPATEMPILCIPAECDTTNRFENTYSNNVIAFRWNTYLLCDICRHFASVMLHFASLISHNLRCIPAYTHQIPMGFFLQRPITYNNMRIDFGGAGKNKRRGEPGGSPLWILGGIGIYSRILDELGDFPHEGAKTEFWCEAVLLVEVVEHAVNTVVFHHHHHCGAH